MATQYSSTTSSVNREEARDAETLLFLDLYSSIGSEPENIPEAERVDAVQSEDSSDVVEPPAFEGIGSTLTDPKLVARFEGVRRDLAREIRSEMCTVEQALRYLEHLEITLLMEQDGDL